MFVGKDEVVSLPKFCEDFHVKSPIDKSSESCDFPRETSSDHPPKSTRSSSQKSPHRDSSSSDSPQNGEDVVPDAALKTLCGNSSPTSPHCESSLKRQETLLAESLAVPLLGPEANADESDSESRQRFHENVLKPSNSRADLPQERTESDATPLALVTKPSDLTSKSSGARKLLKKKLVRRSSAMSSTRKFSGRGQVKAHFLFSCGLFYQHVAIMTFQHISTRQSEQCTCQSI